MKNWYGFSLFAAGLTMLSVLSLVACTHMTLQASTDSRKPAAVGGDVGSVGEPSSVDCLPADDATIAKLKTSATLSAKAPAGNILVVNQEDLKKINDPSVFQDYIKTEFDNNSAMRLQIADQLADLSSNGHNTSNNSLYLSAGGNWCGHLNPNKIKITRISGDPSSKQVLQAAISFSNGYHGGYEMRTMIYQFEAESKIDRGENSGLPNYKPRFSSYLIKYPQFIKTDTVDCMGSNHPSVCNF